MDNFINTYYGNLKSNFTREEVKILLKNLKVFLKQIPGESGVSNGYNTKGLHYGDKVVDILNKGLGEGTVIKIYTCSVKVKFRPEKRITYKKKEIFNLTYSNN